MHYVFQSLLFLLGVALWCRLFVGPIFIRDRNFSRERVELRRREVYVNCCFDECKFTGSAREFRNCIFDTSAGARAKSFIYCSASNQDTGFLVGPESVALGCVAFGGNDDACIVGFSLDDR